MQRGLLHAAWHHLAVGVPQLRRGFLVQGRHISPYRVCQRGEHCGHADVQPPAVPVPEQDARFDVRGVLSVQHVLPHEQVHADCDGIPPRWLGSPPTDSFIFFVFVFLHILHTLHMDKQRLTFTFSTTIGTSNSDACLQQCLAPYTSSLVYTLHSNSVLLYATSEAILSLLPWEWQVVVQSQTSDAVVFANVKQCMQLFSFVFTTASNEGTAVANTATFAVINEEIACGVHMEADLSGGGCACVAGFESVQSSGGGSTCVPCAIDTVRAAGSSGACVACADPTTQHAPNLGMTACICMPGFQLSVDLLRCIPDADPNAAVAFAREPVQLTAVVGSVALALVGLCFVLSRCLL